MEVLALLAGGNHLVGFMGHTLVAYNEATGRARRLQRESHGRVVELDG
jgi:hypothetical protein